MKMSRTLLGVLMISTFFVCFSLGTAQAQNLSNWAGKWFSFTASLSGWEIEGNSVGTAKGGNKGFLEVADVGDVGLTFVLYVEDDNGVWNIFSIPFCEYLGGSDLDFVCRLSGVEDTTGAEFETLLRLTGKNDSKTLLLKSATLKSSGGFFVGNPDEESTDVTAAGLKLSGSLLSVDKFCKGSNLTKPPCLP